MPDTHLILHIKGTEAETATYPKDAVRAALSKGDITHSQLIWSTADNSWKQVRELPDLLPVEELILHVKGTESQTRALPKQAVKAAISKGEITHSQLIWSAPDNAWKQVKELPDLVPEEKLILHVKGTESQTKEMPKQMLQAAVSKGEITHSQLIWSPVNNAWKQVREMPDLLPSEQFILHVKGTEAGTQQLPKPAIRAAITKGEITHSQLIWSTKENAWKQVRDLPELLPSQKLAPAPAPSIKRATSAVPKIVETVIPESPQGPVARAAASAATVSPQPRVASPPTVAPQPRLGTPTPQPRVTAAGDVPKVRVAKAAAAVPQVRAASPSTPAVSSSDLSIEEEEDGFNPLKWICIGMGVFILLIVVANYFLVDQPLRSSLGQTSFADVTVHGHFGAFLQPNVVVIHIPGSAKLTPDNFTQFLVALAHSTPENPIARDVFARVAVTSGWTAQYTFTGYAWKELGDMGQESEMVRKQFIMSQLCGASGDPLMPESTLNEEARLAKRNQVWQAFVDQFAAKP